MFERYEKVFARCRDLTQAAKLPPGHHACSDVSSRLLREDLGAAGVLPEERADVISGWLERTGNRSYYAPLR